LDGVDMNTNCTLNHEQKLQLAELLSESFNGSYDECEALDFLFELFDDIAGIDCMNEFSRTQLAHQIISLTKGES
jgi:hypothetical protein